MGFDPGSVVASTLVSSGGTAVAVVGGGLVVVAVVAVVFQWVLRFVFGVRLVAPQGGRPLSQRWHFERIPVQALRGASPGRQVFGPGLSELGAGGLFQVSDFPSAAPVLVSDSLEGPLDGAEAFPFGRSGLGSPSSPGALVFLSAFLAVGEGAYSWDVFERFGVSGFDVLPALEAEFRSVTGRDIVLAPSAVGRDAALTAYHAGRIIELSRASGDFDDFLASFPGGCLPGDFEV